jgi:choice-of-anchor A domain-containing protein
LLLTVRRKYENYGKYNKYRQSMNHTFRFDRIVLTTLAIAATAVLCSSSASASMIGPVDLGTAGQFTLLALSGGIQDSGPTGPDANPDSVQGTVGIASAGQTFQNSGSRIYNGPIYLHTGDTFNNSAPGVPQPQMSAAIDAMLAQASKDAFAASNFASGLAATATYGNINSSLSITENAAANYVFDIQSINFSGGKTLTLSAPVGSNFILNIASGGITLSPGSIVLSGGLTPDHVLINYTGTNNIQTSGGQNSSRIYANILAPNAHVQLTPGYVAGFIIAASIQMSSGANVVPVPEVTPSSVIFGFIGLVVAFGSRRTLMARVRATSAQAKV